jgi:hypothetical protein
MRKVWNQQCGLAAAVVLATLWFSGCKAPGSLPPTPISPQWSEENPQRANNNTPLLKGSTRHATAIQIFLTPDCTGEAAQVVSVAENEFSFSLQVPDDSTTLISAVATNDSTGLSSGCSLVFTYTEDSTPPAPPVLTGTTPASPNKSTTPKAVGTVEPGARVRVYTDSACAAAAGPEVTANAEGRFEASPAPDAIRADVSLYAAAIDTSGNRSACSSGLRYILDQVPPARPLIIGFVPLSPANNNHPKLRGTAEPGTRVAVARTFGTSCGGTLQDSVLVGPDGTFEVTVSVSDNSSERFSVVAIDPAGNFSECNYSQYYSEDSTPPPVPKLRAGSPASPGASRTPAFSGDTDSSSTVLLYASEGCAGEPIATAQSSGFSFTLNAPEVPANAVSRFSLAARDAAGNFSACTEPVTYQHDGIEPDATAAVVVDGPDADLRFQTHSIMEAHWSGFTDALGVTGYSFAVGKAPGCGTGNILTPWIATTSPQGRVTNLTLPDAMYYHCVRARDAAGNLSAIVSSNGVRIDTAPPTVASHVPRAGQTDAGIRSGVTVTFSEPVDAATVPSRFTLSANGAAIAGTVSCAGASCTFTPDAPLPYRETITVTVAAGVLDTVGRPLAASYTFSFTTQGRRWAMEATAVHDVRPGMNPEVALDGQGNALALWAQRNAQGLWHVYSSRYTAGATWAPAQDIDANAVGSAGRLSLGMNATGRAVALWELQTGTEVDLSAAEYLPGTGWSTPQPVEARPERVSHPQVAVDSQGRGLAVWRQSDGIDESLWAAHHVPGQGWGTPQLLETEPGAISAPSLVADASGTALVAWLQPGAAGTRVLVSRHTPGGGWSAPAQLAASAEGPTVAAGLGADGSALVLFRVLETAGGSTRHRLSASRWEPATGWMAPVLVPAASGSVEEDFAVAVDFQGTALAAWTQVDGAPTLYTSRFTPGGGWATFQKALDSASRPAVAVDAGGNFHLVCIYNYLGSDLVVAARYPEGASALGPAYAIEGTHGATSKRPRITTNAAGGAAAIWARDNGTGASGNLVYANLFQ